MKSICASFLGHLCSLSAAARGLEPSAMACLLLSNTPDVLRLLGIAVAHFDSFEMIRSLRPMSLPCSFRRGWHRPIRGTRSTILPAITSLMGLLRLYRRLI